MPHSGGRVGRGIYFASENGKSASYGQSDITGPEIMKILLLILQMQCFYANKICFGEATIAAGDYARDPLCPACVMC